MGGSANIDASELSLSLVAVLQKDRGRSPMEVSNGYTARPPSRAWPSRRKDEPGIVIDQLSLVIASTSKLSLIHI